MRARVNNADVVDSCKNQYYMQTLMRFMRERKTSKNLEDLTLSFNVPDSIGSSEEVIEPFNTSNDGLSTRYEL